MSCQALSRTAAPVAGAKASAASTSSRQACMAAPRVASISSAQFVVGQKAKALRVGAQATRASVSTAIVAASVAQEPSAQSGTVVKKGEKATFHYLVANAEFFVNDVQNEAFAEQLREKRRYYQEKNLPIDFWLVPEPAFLDMLPDVAKRVKRPAMALVTMDPQWATFMKLRLDRVLKGTVEGTPAEVIGSTGELPKFAPEANWIAPYSKYSDGWWEMFSVDKGLL